MKTSDFDYTLPEELIAQEPSLVRDSCKLLVMGRSSGSLQDKIFRDIYDYIQPGDLLVGNETRVMPVRLLGTKRESGGAAEVFLLREVNDALSSSVSQASWEALVRPGKRLKPGALIDFYDETGALALTVEIVDWAKGAERGQRFVRLSSQQGTTIDTAIHLVGHTPLPPYIKNYTGDEELYQTVFSRAETSAAAPTAGLHFTHELIERIKRKGAFFETVELEVGLDTFRIVEEEDPTRHVMHTERYTVPSRVVDAVNETHQRGGRVIAVGTTSVRSLESAWDCVSQSLKPKKRASTSLFLLPGADFHVVDALITNFHTPRSTLMMLVSAFSSRENIMAAYQHAIASNYRFLSFGDAMFITPDK